MMDYFFSLIGFHVAGVILRPVYEAGWIAAKAIWKNAKENSE